MPTALRVVEGDGELDRDPRSQPHLAERGLFCFCDSGVLFADCHPERLADGRTRLLRTGHLAKFLGGGLREKTVADSLLDGTCFGRLRVGEVRG